MARNKLGLISMKRNKKESERRTKMSKEKNKEKKVEVEDKRVTNKQFTEDDYFRACCVRAHVDPTARQASKFRRKQGSAYKVSKFNRKEEAEKNNKDYRKGNMR